MIFKVYFCSIVYHDPILNLSKSLFSKNTTFVVQAILIIWRILMFFKNTPCIVQNYHHNNEQVFVTFLDNSGNELLQWHKTYYMHFQSVTISNHFWFFFTFKGYVDSILPNIFNVLIRKFSLWKCLNSKSSSPSVIIIESPQNWWLENDLLPR